MYLKANLQTTPTPPSPVANTRPHPTSLTGCKHQAITSTAGPDFRAFLSIMSGAIHVESFNQAKLGVALVTLPLLSQVLGPNVLVVSIAAGVSHDAAERNTTGLMTTCQAKHGLSTAMTAAFTRNGVTRIHASTSTTMSMVASCCSPKSTTS